MSGAEITIHQIEGEWQPAPIPRGWLLAGQPETRNRLLSRSADRMAFTVVWDCTAGSFNWFYDSEETIHVLEGGATLTFNGKRRTIVPGSVVIFPAGCTARWDVDHYVRKLAVFRNTLPPPVSLSLRAWKRLRALLPGGLPASPALA